MLLSEIGTMIGEALVFDVFDEKSSKSAGRCYHHVTCRFPFAETKDGTNVLHAIYGSGATADQATQDYAERLEGTFFVYKAGSTKRIAFQLPDKIVVDPPVHAILLSEIGKMVGETLLFDERCAFSKHADLGMRTVAGARIPDIVDVITCRFPNVAFKEYPANDAKSFEIFGSGATCNEAMQDYVSRIQGMWLVNKDHIQQLPNGIVVDDDFLGENAYRARKVEQEDDPTVDSPPTYEVPTDALDSIRDDAVVTEQEKASLPLSVVGIGIIIGIMWFVFTVVGAFTTTKWISTHVADVVKNTHITKVDKGYQVAIYPAEPEPATARYGSVVTPYPSSGMPLWKPELGEALKQGATVLQDSAHKDRYFATTGDGMTYGFETLHPLTSEDRRHLKVLVAGYSTLENAPNLTAFFNQCAMAGLRFRKIINREKIVWKDDPIWQIAHELVEEAAVKKRVAQQELIKAKADRDRLIRDQAAQGELAVGQGATLRGNHGQISQLDDGRFYFIEERANRHGTRYGHVLDDQFSPVNGGELVPDKRVYVADCDKHAHFLYRMVSTLMSTGYDKRE